MEDNQSIQKETQETKKEFVTFAAINPYIETNVVSSREDIAIGRDFVVWGDRNLYPNYCNSLCDDVTILRTITNGIADYVCGENVKINHSEWAIQVNKDGDTIEDIVKNLATDYARFGGFAINVIRNKIGGIAEVYYVPIVRLRSDKKNEFFFYSEDWAKSYGRCKYTTYAKFRPDGLEASSIFYYKNSQNHVYPQPLYGGDALLAAETERSIQKFNLNAVKNGFASSAIINFNSGVPNDEQKEEIEKDINEKFCGEDNAARVMVAFNNNKENAVSVTKLDADNFAAKYIQLSKSCKQDIFTAFRCNPALFGIPTDGSALNKEDYCQAFRLFNKSVVLPIQKVIKRAFERILQKPDVLCIEPYNIDFADTAEDEVVK